MDTCQQTVPDITSQIVRTFSYYIRITRKYPYRKLRNNPMIIRSARPYSICRKYDSI